METGGFIDLHTHILPGLDDGAKSFEESITIALAARQAGFSTIAATPHFMEGVYKPEGEQIDEGVARLVQLLGADAGEMSIIKGSEYYLDDHFFLLVDAKKLMVLGESKTVLVELPMMRLPPFAAEFAFRLQLKGYTPLLAHPERYHDIASKPKRIRELTEKGFLVQVNLGSLSGLYGRTVTKAARYIIEKGYATVCASDIHSPKHIDDIYTQGVAALIDLAGDSAVKQLLVTGPKQLLLNEDEIS